MIVIFFLIFNSQGTNFEKKLTILGKISFFSMYRNAWKTVRCESVERRRGDCLNIFWWKLAEIIGWLEEQEEDGECEKCVEGE